MAITPTHPRLLPNGNAFDRPLASLVTVARTTVVGRHRARFLHAMTTAEIQQRKPGEAGFALMATANGRHVGQVRFEIEGDTIQLVGRRASLDAVLVALAKHRIADDVRWSEPVSEALLALYGDGAAAVAEAALGTRLGAARPAVDPASALGAFEDVAWSDGTVRVTRVPAIESELGRPALHLRTTPALGPSLRVRLLAAGAEPLDDADWERLRIEAGWPLDGVDLTPEDVALASERLAATVSWTKGCFLGQEVYVMARDRGELPRRLRGVVVPGGALPPAHAELYQADAAPPKVQGLVGSAAPVASGGYLALAMVKRKAAEPGTELALADGRRVRVVALPRPKGLE